MVVYDHGGARRGIGGIIAAFAKRCKRLFAGLACNGGTTSNHEHMPADDFDSFSSCIKMGNDAVPAKFHERAVFAPVPHHQHCSRELLTGREGGRSTEGQRT